MFTSYQFIISLLILILMLPVHADSWRAELKDGGTVQVDPQTHKPTMTDNGQAVPLWNGVHKLDNGSVIIVRDGVVVPNATMYQTWEQPAAPKPPQSINTCEQLVNRTCGTKNFCANTQACELARQLYHLWENTPDSVPGGISRTGQEECIKGLLYQKTFPPCQKDSNAPDTCTSLVSRVCGDNNQCNKAPACNAAHQLLELVKDAYLNNPESAENEHLATQCQDAKDIAFFTTCKIDSTPISAPISASPAPVAASQVQIPASKATPVNTVPENAVSANTAKTTPTTVPVPKADATNLK